MSVTASVAAACPSESMRSTPLVDGSAAYLETGFDRRLGVRVADGVHRAVPASQPDRSLPHGRRRFEAPAERDRPQLLRMLRIGHIEVVEHAVAVTDQQVVADGHR